jgi:hypothetical protein
VSPVTKNSVLTFVSMKMAVFWIVAPCRLVEVPLRRSQASRQHGTRMQKTVIVTINSVCRISFEQEQEQAAVRQLLHSSTR